MDDRKIIIIMLICSAHQLKYALSLLALVQLTRGSFNPGLPYNHYNLINIPITKDKSFYSKSMNFGLLNARSVKAKDRADEINEFISDHSLDHMHDN